MKITLPPDFREFLSSLNSHGVEYLVVGGYAVGIHGHPRGTGDLDVWVSTHPDNATKVLAALKAFGFDLPASQAHLVREPNQVLRMGTPPLRIELLTGISGVQFDECAREAYIEQVDGVEVRVIGLRHLKLNKRAAGRSRDLDDLERLP